MNPFYFARPALTDALVRDLTGGNLFSDAANGLFLAAPRRTGKSTFLRNELQPALENAGRVVVYVDLWSDKNRDPGALIAEAIGKELGKHLGIVAKTAKAAGIEHMGLGNWLKVDPAKIGKTDGLTLADAVRALRETSGKAVALIIDEAQHALTSLQGESAMTALKSARDQLNMPDAANLLLIMSGSDRDKLLRLLNTNAAPFFGSAISLMPQLGVDFIAHVADMITRTYPQLAPVDIPQLWEAFQRFAQRPQPFVRTLGQILNPLHPPERGFERQVLEMADLQRADDERAMESAYLALRPLEQAVLWRMLEQGDRFRPYDADALVFYREKTGEKITAQKAQNAIESLRMQTPSLIWKSAKGEYALDDAGMKKWFKQRCEAGVWPPQSPYLNDAEEDGDGGQPSS